MEYLERLIQSCMELGAAHAMVTLGLASGEITQRKARDTYGKYFTDAEKEGRIRPCRMGKGDRPARYYKVEDIIALKVADAVKAELK